MFKRAGAFFWGLMGIIMIIGIIGAILFWIAYGWLYTGLFCE